MEAAQGQESPTPDRLGMGATRAAAATERATIAAAAWGAVVPPATVAWAAAWAAGMEAAPGQESPTPDQLGMGATRAAAAAWAAEARAASDSR